MTRDEQLISLCQSLIRIPSLSGQEEQVARFIEKTMHAYGYDEVQIDKHGSVLGCIRGKRPGKRILMDGHIDTVDIADRDRWTHDPFGAEIENGRIYGRGTSDMKGSVSAMISAAARFAEDTNRDFAGSIYVSGSARREISRVATPSKHSSWTEPET